MEDAKEIAESIKATGVIQPICVTPDKNGYEIIWGYTRYFGSILADKEDIPCQIIKNISDEEKLKLALIENTQRKELSPIEEAKSYKRMIEELKYTQEKVARIVNKDRSRISHIIQLLNLPEEIQASVRQRTLTPRHAEILLRIESKELQLKAYHIIELEDLSVRQTEELIEKMMKLEKKKKVNEGDDLYQPDTIVYAIGSWLAGNLRTEINIREFKKKRKLEITFGTKDDLIKLISRFSRLKISESDLKTIKQQYEKEIADAM